MKKIKIKFDYVSFFDEEFSLYLSKLDGVTSANIDTKNDYVIVEYDDNLISLKVLVKEMLLYLDLIKIPSITSFDKCSNNHICKDTIVIYDVCCEYCLKSILEELLETKGIISAYSDFDYHNLYNVNIFITYDTSIISKKGIDNLKMKLNSY